MRSTTPSTGSSVAADQQTRGKYTAKIAKAGQKAGEAVDKFAEPGGAAESGRQPSDSDD